MFIGIGIVLLVIWALCFLVFHLTMGAIHVLLGLAVVAIIWHFVSAGRTRV